MRRVRLGSGKDKRAEVGVGTIVIFIAMVLTSGVASSIVLDQASQVREQSTNTFQDSMDEVMTGLTVREIQGQVNRTTLTVESFSMLAQLSLGSSDLMLEDVLILLTGDDFSYQLTLGNVTSNTTFTADQVLGDSLWNETAHVVGHDDLIRLTVHIDGGVGAGEEVTIEIVPLHGQNNIYHIKIPEVLSSTYIDLR